MLETYCRHHYQRLLVDPLATMIKRIDFITPNLISLFACLIGILTWPLITYHDNYLAIIFLWLSGYLDTLDGTLARMSQRHSNHGTMLDIMSDRIVEFAVIFALLSINPAQRAFICLMMLASISICVNTFLVAGIFNRQASTKSFYYSPGFIERAEAFIFFTAMVIFPTVFNSLAITFSLLVLYTTFMHMWHFFKH